MKGKDNSSWLQPAEEIIKQSSQKNFQAVIDSISTDVYRADFFQLPVAIQTVVAKKISARVEDCLKEGKELHKLVEKARELCATSSEGSGRVVDEACKNLVERFNLAPDTVRNLVGLPPKLGSGIKVIV
jgi:hypothetical protein